MRIAKWSGIVFASIIFCAALASFLMQQSYRLQNRTVDGRQFSLNAEYWQTNLRAIRDFESTHQLNPEARGGFRLAIDEWPSWKYTISIEIQQGGTARGAIRAVPYDGHGPVFERDFRLEKDVAKVLFNSFDNKVDGYWGDSTVCSDGTGFQFERWDNGRATGGAGNAACQLHYAQLMSLVAEVLVVPVTDVPFDWRTWFSAKRELQLASDES